MRNQHFVDRRQGFISLTERKCHLTARTRNKDDFPAFCNPTMVTSISVALHHHHGSIAVRNILLGLSLAAFAFDAAIADPADFAWGEAQD